MTKEVTNKGNGLRTPEAVEMWLGHVKALSEGIGPRGSATEAERQGSEYCAATLQSLGFQPVFEQFSSSGSVFLPHLAAALGALAAFALYPLAPPVTKVAAFILSAAVVVSELLELGLRDNPLRWTLPRRTSQNVHAVLTPAGPIERDIILMGHVDSQRTPIIFSSRRWLDVYKIVSGLTLLSFLGQVALYAVGALTGWAWAWPLSTVSAFFALVLAALVVHAETTPYTPGANDNATAVGLVLTLAANLARAPLARTRVWFVCTGCEEALHEGARYFLAKHRRGMQSPAMLNFEMLGCAGPAWLIREGIVTPLHPSPELRRLAEEVAAEHPELEAYPGSIAGGVTEASDAMNAGIPALTLMGVDLANQAPYWHKMADTFDKMRPEIMARAYEFTLRLLEKMGNTDNP